jgi:protein-disulfide isomerase
MTRRPFLACTAFAVLLAFVPVRLARAQQQPSEADLRAEIEALKKGQDAIRADLQEIKKLLQARQAVPAVPDAKAISLDIAGHPIEGDPKAPLTLVEFSDYQCPFCARHHNETQPKLNAELIGQGKLRRVFFDLPLENIHPNAFKAAEASRCALDQGKYFEMQDRLFANAQKLDQWSAHAAAVGLDLAEFTECLETGRHAGDVRSDMSQAHKAGINSTPIFLVGRSDPTNPTLIRGLVLITGARPYETFRAEVEKALAAR